MEQDTEFAEYRMRIPGLGWECALVFVFTLLLQTWLLMVCGGRPVDPADFQFGVWPTMVLLLDPWLTGFMGLPLGGASLLSIFSIALGLLCFHFANRLHGAHRDQSYLMLLLFLALPATLTQIIAPSPMGPFLGAMGVVYLCATVLVTRPTVLFVTLFGVATAATYMIHWVGAFLPLLLLPWVLLRNRDLYGDLFPHFLLGAHAMLVHSLLVLSTALLGTRFSLGISNIRSDIAGAFSSPHLVQTAISEILFPFFPLVLATIPAVWKGELKWRIAIVFAAVIPCALMILGQGPSSIGAGALLVPIAFASLLCLRDLLEERSVLGAATVVALLFGSLSLYEARFQDAEVEPSVARKILPLKMLREGLRGDGFESAPLAPPQVPGKE
jgi:hypothetical protein